MSVKINVKNISDDNGVKVVFYDVSGNVIKKRCVSRESAWWNVGLMKLAGILMAHV